MTPSIALVGERQATATHWDESLSVTDLLSVEELHGLWSDFVLLCPAGVTVQPNLRALVDEMLVHHPDVDLCYFDSCRRSDQHETTAGETEQVPTTALQAEHRPAFSPDRLRSQMYLGELLLLRRSVLIDTMTDGGIGQSVKLPLTGEDANVLANRCRAIAHLPRIAFASSPQVESSVIDLRPGTAGRPPVSIVIATKGSEREIGGRVRTLVVHAVDSLVARTAYENYELVIMMTPGTPDDLPERIMQATGVHGEARRPPVRFCRDDRPFNYSNVNNRGAVLAEGNVLVFLNDDTEVHSPEWLDRLVNYAGRPEIGAVGARLLYEDGTIQHAGIWSRGGYPAHRYTGFAADHPGHLQSLTVPQNCLAVTGACLTIEAEKFFAVGGFCPDFPSSYNDVDLCLKLHEQGYRIVVLPDAVLTHFEASTRRPTISDEDFELLQRRWGRLVNADPYDNPNHLAPEANEFPAPEASVTLMLEKAGAVDHHPRVWRRPRDYA